MRAVFEVFLAPAARGDGRADDGVPQRCALVMLAYSLLFFSFLRWLHSDLLFLHKCANSFITAYEYCTNKPFINPQKVDQ